MNTPRLEQLLQFYKEEPNDPFNLYALGNEYKSVDINTALDYFEKLVDLHPDYIATYYHLAQIYLDLGENEKAKLTYEKGIEKAQKTQEPLLLRELKNAYNEFLMDI
jgi:tetratricopeptide (TPR) repeat protein